YFLVTPQATRESTAVPTGCPLASASVTEVDVFCAGTMKSSLENCSLHKSHRDRGRSSASQPRLERQTAGSYRNREGVSLDGDLSVPDHTRALCQRRRSVIRRRLSRQAESAAAFRRCR